MFGIKTKLYNPFIAIPMHLSCNLVTNTVSRHSVVGNHQGKPMWVPQFNLGAEWATDWYGYGYREPSKACSSGWKLREPPWSACWPTLNILWCQSLSSFDEIRHDYHKLGTLVHKCTGFGWFQFWAHPWPSPQAFSFVWKLPGNNDFNLLALIKVVGCGHVCQILSFKIWWPPPERATARTSH